MSDPRAQIAFVAIICSLWAFGLALTAVWAEKNADRWAGSAVLFAGCALVLWFVYAWKD